MRRPAGAPPPINRVTAAARAAAARDRDGRARRARTAPSPAAVDGPVPAPAAAEAAATGSSSSCRCSMPFSRPRPAARGGLFVAPEPAHEPLIAASNRPAKDRTAEGSEPPQGDPRRLARRHLPGWPSVAWRRTRRDPRAREGGDASRRRRNLADTPGPPASSPGAWLDATMRLDAEADLRNVRAVPLRGCAAGVAVGRGAPVPTLRLSTQDRAAGGRAAPAPPPAGRRATDPLGRCGATGARAANGTAPATGRVGGLGSGKGLGQVGLALRGRNDRRRAPQPPCDPGSRGTPRAPR